jgi:hypothetical protein
MAQRRFYFLWEEAQRLKETYSSWLNKVAYIDKGKLSELKKIAIKPKRTFLKQDQTIQTYHVEFHFESKIIDASHFLLSNGLSITNNILSSANRKSKSSK